MRAAGVPAPTVLFDPAYGNDGKFRAGITAEGLPYVAGVFASLLVWRPGEVGERRASRKPGETRPQPVQVKTLAMELPTDAWQTITWREGSNMLLTSRFTRLRVRPAPQAAGRSELAAEQWLLIEWPVGEAAPDHYWLSTLSADIEFERMVDLAKLRWRIERDFSNSSKRSDRATSRAAGGEAFITMPVSASRPMASWSPSGRLAPLRRCRSRMPQAIWRSR